MDPRKGRAFYELLKFSSLGLEMGAAVAIGLAMGFYLDKWMGTRPWMTILFLFFGMAAAGKAVYRAVREGMKEAEKDEEGGNGDG